MKKRFCLSMITMILLLFVSSFGYSQTSGNLTFSLTTATPSGSYGSRNLLAVWIENATGTFIKTKIKYSKSGDATSHLATWSGKSANSVIDATSGSSRSTNGVVSFTWNGTNEAGTVVPDGVYRVYAEIAWDDSKTLGVGKNLDYFTFTKGPAAVQLTPVSAVPANFTAVSLSWNPVQTSIADKKNNQMFNVFPNPTNGLVNIGFNQDIPSFLVKITNLAGKEIYNETIKQKGAGVVSWDLSKYASGIYFVNITSQNKKFTYKVNKQ